MNEDIRWQQRFENFDRAVALLREPIERGVTLLSNLEKEGTIQRFEVTVELAWKILHDYLTSEGRVVQSVTPRNVFKEAFATGIVRDGQVWIDMLNHRNLLSHTYDASVFDQAVLELRDRYFPAIKELHAWFLERRTA